MSDNELPAILAFICILLMIAIKFINGTKVFLIHLSCNNSHAKIEFINGTKVFLTHLVVFGLYSLFMLYGQTFEGKDGTSIVWFSIFAVSYVAYIALTTVYIIFKLIF